jgi:GNAT superfamily N-acetyltransferase
MATRGAAAFSSFEVVFRPATPSRWPDVERLFGDRGACGGCWCMAWRLPRKDFDAGKGASNRKRLRLLVSKGRRPGVLAYLGRSPMGWCAVAPRGEYSVLARSKVLAPVDEAQVWSISCLFVSKAYRRRGLSVALLQAASEFAARRGAQAIEGYPVEPSMQKTPDAFAWTGLPSAFRRAGFVEIARRSPSRPIMRKTLSTS